MQDPRMATTVPADVLTSNGVGPSVDSLPTIWQVYLFHSYEIFHELFTDYMTSVNGLTGVIKDRWRDFGKSLWVSKATIFKNWILNTYVLWSKKDAEALHTN